MNFNEMEAAVKDAERKMNLVDAIATRMARLLLGRLRQVDLGWRGYSILGKLKRELSEFNANTNEWKS